MYRLRAQALIFGLIVFAQTGSLTRGSQEHSPVDVPSDDARFNSEAFGPWKAFADPFDASKIITEFVAAHNSGKIENLQLLVRKYYDAEFVRSTYGSETNAAARLLDLYRLYGPVRFHSVQKDFSPPIHWTQGIETKGWLGLQWRENDSGRLAHTIWRTRPPSAEVSPALQGPSLKKALSQYLLRVESKGNFSGVVLVAKEGKILFEGAYGYSEANNRRNHINTRFNIGSVTKMLVGTAVLHLVEDGRIKLDDHIGKYIDEYPSPASQTVTVRHLLTHASGIEFDDLPGFVDARRKAETVENILKVQLAYAEQAGIARDDFRPSGEFNYSNDNFEMLGVIIQRVTGKPWEQVVRESILNPLRLKQTTFAMHPEKGNAAIGYSALLVDTETYSADGRRDARPLLLKRASPSGQMYSTARDLHSFVRGLLENRLLSVATTREMFKKQISAGELQALKLESAYGFGVQISTGYGITTKGHGGVVPGYSAQLQWYPELGYEVVVLSNFGDTAAHIVAQRIEDLVTDL